MVIATFRLSLYIDDKSRKDTSEEVVSEAVRKLRDALPEAEENLTDLIPAGFFVAIDETGVKE